MSSWQCLGEFREADQLGEGGGEALFPLLGPHPDWSQVSGAGGRGRWAVWLEPAEPGGNGLGEGSWLHLRKRGGEAVSDLRTRHSGAHLLGGECVASGDKGTGMFWDALREVHKET